MVVKVLAQLHLAGPVIRARIPKIHPFDNVGVGNDSLLTVLSIPLHRECAAPDSQRLFTNRLDRPARTTTNIEAERTQKSAEILAERDGPGFQTFGLQMEHDQSCLGAKRHAHVVALAISDLGARL